MYNSHSEIITPDRSHTIWRYMPLDIFLSLLNDRQLYFARQDKFFDLLEGKRSAQDLVLYNNAVPGISEIIEKDSFGCAFINCWIMSDVDSFLMWNTYSSLEKGIAIKSTIGNLIASLDSNDKRPIYISNVKYMDYSKEPTFNKAGGSANDLARYFCKRNYFQQENELRLVYYDYQMKLDESNKLCGMKFNVSLNTLIDEVYIAPRAESWYLKLIEEEMRLHNIFKPIKLSYI